MKTLAFFMATILTASAFATGRVNNGIIPMRRIYNCTEMDPKNPNDKLVLVLDQVMASTLLLKVYSSADMSQPILSERVVANKDIRCVLPCGQYDDMNGERLFMVNILPNEVRGSLKLDNETVRFTCGKPKYN